MPETKIIKDVFYILLTVVLIKYEKKLTGKIKWAVNGGIESFLRMIGGKLQLKLYYTYQ